MAPHQTTSTAAGTSPAAALLTLPAQAAEQQPVRTLSRLDCVAFIYGHDTALHATWQAELAGVPLTWLAIDRVLQ